METVQVKIKDEAELEEFARHCLKHLVNVLFWEEYWGEHFGASARDSRNEARKRAHTFLNKYKVETQPLQPKIEIVLE